MIWFDTHAHIHGPEFSDDFSDVLTRARTTGVTRILLAGIDEPDSRVACQLAVDNPMLYVSVGIHPHDAKTWSRVK